jgi:hypothetical protein
MSVLVFVFGPCLSRFLRWLSDPWCLRERPLFPFPPALLELTLIKVSSFEFRYNLQNLLIRQGRHKYFSPLLKTRNRRMRWIIRSKSHARASRVVDYYRFSISYGMSACAIAVLPPFQPHAVKCFKRQKTSHWSSVLRKDSSVRPFRTQDTFSPGNGRTYWGPRLQMWGGWLRPIWDLGRNLALGLRRITVDLFVRFPSEPRGADSEEDQILFTCVCNLLTALSNFLTSA